MEQLQVVFQCSNFPHCFMSRFQLRSDMYCLKCYSDIEAADREVLTISNSFMTIEQIEQSERARGGKKVSQCYFLLIDCKSHVYFVNMVVHS